MRRFRVIVPRDTTAANTDRICADALRQLEVTIHASTLESSTLD